MLPEPSAIVLLVREGWQGGKQKDDCWVEWVGSHAEGCEEASLVKEKTRDDEGEAPISMVWPSPQMYERVP